MKYLLLFSLFFFVFIINGCTDLTDSEGSNTIVITFQEDWLCSDCGEGILFYSDLDGTLLWERGWTGDDTLNLDKKDFADRVSITTVVQNEEGDIELTTNYSIVPASWTFRGWPPIETVGNVNLEFQNIPEHQGYIAASKYNRRSSRTGSIYSSLSKSITVSPDNIFIRLNTTANGPSFMWIEDVFAGETRTIDLSNLQLLQSKDIAFPISDEEISFNLSGFFNQDYYSGNYSIDYIYGYNYNQTAKTHTAYYPKDIFPDYRTSGYINEETYPTNNYWNHTVLGNIPSAIQKINADFNFVTTSPTNFEISATGDYHSVNSYWEYEDGNGQKYYWNVHTSQQKFKLPELPESVKTKYPGLSREFFTLEYTGISKNVNLQSYDELIKKMFHQGQRYYNFVNEVYGRNKDPNGLRP